MRHREIDKEYRCCLCCHVKTGTILLGLWQVVVHVAVMGVLAALVTHPEFFNREEKSRLQTSVNVIGLGQKDAIVFNDHKAGSLSTYQASKLPTKGEEKKNDHQKLSSSEKLNDHVVSSKMIGLSDSDYLERKLNSRKYEHDIHIHTHHHHRNGRWRSEDQYVGMALTFLSLVFSGLMLYGALRERPSYLMPYFCLQVFDFVISCLSIVGYFSYLPDVKLWLRAQRDMPYKQELLMMDQATLTFTAMALCLLVLAIKAYLLGMVWTCYKFLVRKQTGQLGNGSLTRGGLFLGGFYEAGELGLLQASHNHSDEEGVAMGMLPPKYDDVLKTPANAFAPPPYFRRVQLEAQAQAQLQQDMAAAASCR